MPEGLGVDAFHVTGGDHHTMTYQVSPMLMPRGIHVWAAEAVKAAVSVPVIASGSITCPIWPRRSLLLEGRLRVAGPPLLADPNWPRKVREGRVAEIRPCIRCNDGCFDRTFMRYQAATCSVNPQVGHEGEWDLKPPLCRSGSQW